MSSSLRHSLSFADRSVSGNILCAPLAGFTDIPFRELAVRMGADLTYTEMVSAEALVRDNGRTMELLRRASSEMEYGIQLFTASPEAAAGALSCIESFRPLVIDLNCGCPVPKVIKNGAGAALMKNPPLIAEIVRALRGGTKIPISVKLRTGWDHQHYTYIEAASRAREAGASLVSLHGRTRSQGYGGRADWEAIASLKQAMDIPVIGNGDIFCAADAERMLTETGCDGVMVARGALGNPFIFREIRALLSEGRSLPPPTPRERIETALCHLERAVEVKGERTAVKEMKKQLCAYTKGISGSAAFRNQLVHCDSVEEYRRHFADFLASVPA